MMTASLRAAASDPAEALDCIAQGIPWAEAAELATWLDVPIAKLATMLQISPATMTRRKRSRFAGPESDRILRFARLWLLACDAVGGAEGARSWLKRPQYGLDGAIPIDLAQSETGAREVETLLHRILYGVLA